MSVEIEDSQMKQVTPHLFANTYL